MKELDIKSLIKSIWTLEAGPNPHCHALMCLLFVHKLSSEKNGQMTKLSPNLTFGILKSLSSMVRLNVRSLRSGSYA